MSTLTATLPMSNLLTDALKAAEVSARKFTLPFITGENLLVALTEQSSGQACEMLSKNTPATIREQLEKYLKNKVGDPSNASKILKHDPVADKLLLAAIDEAQKRGDAKVGTGHLILAMLKFPHSVCGMYLTFNGLNYSDVSANSNAIFAKNKEDATILIVNPLPAGNRSTRRRTHRNTSKAQPTQVTPCGTGCGCATSIQDQSAALGITPATPAATPDPMAVRKAKWQDIFEIAWSIAQKTNLSIPAAFIQASMSAPQLMDKEAAKIIRKNALNDAAQKVLDLA